MLMIRQIQAVPNVRFAPLASLHDHGPTFRDLGRRGWFIFPRTRRAVKARGVLHFAEVLILLDDRQLNPAECAGAILQFPSEEGWLPRSELNLHYFLFATLALNRTHDFQAGFGGARGA